MVFKSKIVHKSRSLSKFWDSHIYNLQNTDNIDNTLFVVFWNLHRKNMQGIIEVGQKYAQTD